jgi:hypothetical protein
MQLHLEQYPQYKHDVSALLRAIGAKLPSRQARVRFLEREVHVNGRLRDAPSLLRDLMHVGYSVMCAQFSVVIGVPDMLALSAHGAPFYGSLMLSQDAVAPLHDSRNYSKSEGVINAWYQKVNPRYRMYVLRLCKLLALGVGQDEAGAKIGFASFALESAQVLRAMIHVEDPTSKHVHAATGSPEEVARYHANLQVRWEAFLAGSPPLKGVPSTPSLWWVQDKARAVGVPEAALTLCESPDKRVRLEAWMLLRDMLHGGNQAVQQTLVNSANVKRLSRSLARALAAADDELANYRSRRRAYVQKLKHAAAAGDGGHAQTAHQDSVLGPLGETALALTVSQQLLSCVSAGDLKGEGGVVHAAGRLLLRLQDVLALALNDGDHEPVELATQVCYVLAAGISGNCCERYPVFQGVDADSERMRFGLMIQRCLSGLQYHTNATRSAFYQPLGGANMRSMEMNEHLCDLRRALFHVCLLCASEELRYLDASAITAHVVRLGVLIGLQPREPTHPVLDEHARFCALAGVKVHEESAASAAFEQTLENVPLGEWYRSKGLQKELLKGVMVLKRLEHMHGVHSPAARAAANLKMLQPKLWAYAQLRVRCVEVKCEGGSLERIHFTVDDSLLAIHDSQRLWVQQNDALLQDCLEINVFLRAKAFVGRMREQLCVHRALTAYDNFSTRWLLWAVLYRSELEAVPRMISVAAMLVMVIFYGVPTAVDPSAPGSFVVGESGYAAADASVGKALAGPFRHHSRCSCLYLCSHVCLSP